MTIWRSAWARTWASRVAGSGFVPKADTVIEAGDEVLLVLDPGLEETITTFFAPDGQAAAA